MISGDSTRGDTDWFDCGVDQSCKIFSEKKNWYGAEAACNAAYGHLASIVSQTNDRDKITLAARVGAFYMKDRYLLTVNAAMGWLCV